jgi:NitT/TauT family transport system ATP-binding protein
MRESPAVTSEFKLVTNRLSKSFQQRETVIPAVADISLSIREGEFVSIVGASGCGKTTLLRMLDGLLKPTSGTIEIDGRPVTEPGKSSIAFVFQQDRLFPWRGVDRNTLLGPEIQHRQTSAVRTLAGSLIDLVGLFGFEKHYPHELSGGMRQRVNLARALAVEPGVLLMDEPFASLDAQTREIMQTELLRIWRETKKTVIFVTHQIDEAVFLSDRVFVLTVRPGRIKEEIAIDLPRPRDLDIKRSPEFARYTDRIWRLIEQEVRDGIGLEAQQAAALRARQAP